MIPRIIVAALLVVLLASSASPQKTRQIKRWNPINAVADAERDIASRNIRFAYIGGIASHAPGLPQDGRTWLYVLHHYPQLEVGSQDCEQDEYFTEREEYATKYNQRMWSYVAKHR